MPEQDSSRLDQELEALLSSMPDESQETVEGEKEAYSPLGYGSEDENFDQLFLELLSHDDGKSAEKAAAPGQVVQEDQDVDMSTG